MAAPKLIWVLVLGYATLVVASATPEETSASHSQLIENANREDRQVKVKQSLRGVQTQEEEVSPLPADPSDDPIDRKDARVQETNEVNPYQLFPPGFHEILAIPVHQFSNGTTYNPSDKYKPPKSSKYPLVSSGYAKVQGTASKTTKSTPRPERTTTVKTTTESYDYDQDYTTKAPRRPVTKRPQYDTYTTTPKSEPYTKPSTSRPTEQYTPDQAYETDRYVTKPPRQPYDSQTSNAKNREPYPEYRPTYERQPEHSEYPPVEEVSYVRPTPQFSNKPTYNRPVASVHEAPAYVKQPQYTDYPTTTPPQVTEEPVNSEDNNDSDIIYDYEEGQQEGDGGVMFVVNNPRPDIPLKLASAPPAQIPTQLGREPVGVVEKVPRDPPQAPSPFKPSPLFQTNFPADFGKPPNFGNNFQRPQPEQQPPPANGFAYNSFPPGFADRPNKNVYAPNSAPLRGRPEPQPPQQPSAVHHASQPRPLNLERYPAQAAPSNLERYPAPRPEPNGAEYPRPPFSNGGLRFPQQRIDTNMPVNPSDEASLPNILPQFRPNAKDDEFIPRPYNQPPQPQTLDNRPSQQPTVNNRPQPQNFDNRPQAPQNGFDARPNYDYRQPQPQGQPGKPQREAPPSSPLSSISQAVANFFGRRSSNGNQKMSNQGEVGNPNPNPVAMRLRSKRQAQPSAEGFVNQGPSDHSPAFYVYTSHGLERGEPPFLVVGPRNGPPPEVPGAKLVHSVPASQQPQQNQPIVLPASISRRQDGPAPLPVNRRDSLEFLPIPHRPFPDNRREGVDYQSQFTRPLPFNTRQPEAPYQENRIRPPIASSIRRPPPVGVLFQNKPGFENQTPKPAAVQVNKVNQGVAPQYDRPPQNYIVPPRKPLNPLSDIADLNTVSVPQTIQLLPPVTIKPFVNRKPVEEPSLDNHRLPANYKVPAEIPAPFAIEADEDETGTESEEIPLPSASRAPLQLPTRPSTTAKPVEEKSQPLPTTFSYVPISRTTTTTTTTTTTPKPSTASRYNYAYDPNVVGTISKDTQKGELVAVVQPAYVYPLDKSDPGAPELFSLDAPFFPSVQAQEGHERNSQYIPQTVNWYAVRGSETQAASSDSEIAASNVPSSKAPSSPAMESGFLPVVPHTV